MVDAKPVNVSLGGHFKLSKAQEPKTDEKSLMSKVSYASTMSSLMYAIVYMRPNIAQVVGVIRKYMSNLGQKQWRAIK